MPLYKQVLLTSRKATPKQVAKIFQECANIITLNGGVIRGIENRGERRLGYGIKDRRWGELQCHYDAKLIVSQFNSTSDVLKQIDKKLKNSFCIIRYGTFQIRDPIDSFINTHKSLEAWQSALKNAKDIPSKEKFHLEKEERKREARRPMDTLDVDGHDDDDHIHDDEEEDDDLSRFIPEWKRDASFEPTPPEHLKTEK
uniref:Uncharacterized protein AlNc14C166G7897 n=1 Tax=Albugo laibachii Nc14 TaxID=890382 RepID=F0WN64_9STRA|nr:conserved hypothetical protein [Albugo laibachii Nc14]|eukprot:CCA22753.1 conserved hypothetical protein [Albugo laibachii Nc14]